MSESSKRNRKPVQKFEAWAEGDKHAPLYIRQKKRREQAKGREKREKLKQKKMGQTEEGNVEMNQNLEESLVQENLVNGKDNLVKEVVDSSVMAGESSNYQPNKKKLKKQNKNNSK